MNATEHESRQWQVARIIKLVAGLDTMAVVRVVYDLRSEYSCLDDAPDQEVYEKYCKECERV